MKKLACSIGLSCPLTDVEQESHTASVTRYLEKKIGQKLLLRVNENSSTMLSVRWEPTQTRVSLHRMFLQAPANIVDALACYLKNGKKPLAPQIRDFIEQTRSCLDYSKRVNPNRLCQCGTVHDLAEIYDEVNMDYFSSKLKLWTTWYGSVKPRGRRHVQFGAYQDIERVIRINRLLDRDVVPRFIVAYVVYHEMLHAVCLPTFEGRRRRVHTREFLRRERQFSQFEAAQQWIEGHQELFFVG